MCLCAHDRRSPYTDRCAHTKGTQSRISNKAIESIVYVSMAHIVTVECARELLTCHFSRCSSRKENTNLHICVRQRSFPELRAHTITNAQVLGDTPLPTEIRVKLEPYSSHLAGGLGLAEGATPLGAAGAAGTADAAVPLTWPLTWP